MSRDTSDQTNQEIVTKYLIKGKYWFGLTFGLISLN